MMLTSQKSRQTAYFGAVLHCRLKSHKQSMSSLEDFKVKTMFKQHINDLNTVFVV